MTRTICANAQHPGRTRDAPGAESNSLSPMCTVLLAVTLGVCGGYLDLLVMIFRKYCWNDLRYFWSGSDFPWSVPVVHAVQLGVAGVVVAIVNWVRLKAITLPAMAWLFAAPAIWAALLRMPVYGVCMLLFAAGLARPVSTAVVAYSRHPRQRGSSWRGSSAYWLCWRLCRPAQRDPGVPCDERPCRFHRRVPQRRADRLGHRPRLQP